MMAKAKLPVGFMRRHLPLGIRSDVSGPSLMSKANRSHSPATPPRHYG
jgi:hypothetical protein